MAAVHDQIWATDYGSIEQECSSLIKSTGPRKGVAITTMPPELRNVPESFKHVEKLIQIVEWSLKVPVERSHVEVAEHLQASNENSNVVMVSSPLTTRERPEAPSLSTQPSPADRSESDNDIPKLSKSLSSEMSQHSSNPPERLSKLQTLKKGVRLSTADLLNSIRDNGGRDQGSHTARTVLIKIDSSKSSYDMTACTSCFEDLPRPDSIVLPCTHAYCKVCLIILIMTAIKEESLFPPKCCLSAIPLRTVLLVLDAKQRELYRSKSAEYLTPVDSRWYCPNTNCLKWVPPSRLQWLRTTTMKCQYCATKICGTCRGKAHKARTDCLQDYGLGATLEVAEAEGWQRCFSCRAIVELIIGCRHITCKCGAHFCYVCGAKWRTCRCSETDQINRQALLRERRESRNAVAQAEADEIAQAIAEVEAMERIEEEERRRRQRERELERQREDAELARLEQLRFDEEALRKQQAEKAEKKLRQATILSIKQNLESLAIGLSEVAAFQKRAIDHKYKLEEQQIQKDYRTNHEQLQNYANSLIRKIEHNSEKRKIVLLERQNSDLCSLSQQHEEQEDDLFLRIQLHLRDKPNQESREKRMQESLTKQHDEERNELLTKHQLQLQTLEHVANMEVQGLEHSNAARLTKAIRDHKREIRKMSKNCDGDRAWFEIANQRRTKMVQVHERLLLEQVESGVELTGLTEEAAVLIEPRIPAESSLNGSSGAVLTENEVEKSCENLSKSTEADLLLKLPETHGISRTASVRNRKSSRSSKQLTRTINADETWSFAALKTPVDVRESGSDLISSAWTWMTGSSYLSTRRRLSEDIQKEIEISAESWREEPNKRSVQSTPEISPAETKFSDASSIQSEGTITIEKQEMDCPRELKEAETNPYRRPRRIQPLESSPDDIFLSPEIAAIAPFINVSNDTPSPPGAFPLASAQTNVNDDIVLQVAGPLEQPSSNEANQNDNVAVGKRASTASLTTPTITLTMSTTSASGSGISRNWPKWPLRRYNPDRCTEELVREEMRLNTGGDLI